MAESILRDNLIADDNDNERQLEYEKSSEIFEKEYSIIYDFTRNDKRL